MHLKNAADGRPVLLVHGNPGSRDDFAELAPRLAFASEVLAIDLPGFGKRAVDVTQVTPSTLTALAGVAFSIVDRLGWRRFDVIGHSHGAGIAQAMAWLESERVATLLLVGSMGLSPHPAYRQLSLPGATWAMSLMGRCLGLPGGKAWLRTVQRRVLKTAFFPDLVPLEHLNREVERVLREPRILVRMAELASAGPCAELASHAVHIITPTHFVHGASDRLVPERYPRAIHEMRTQAGRASSFELIADAGHLLPLTHAADLAERYRLLSAFDAARERGHRTTTAPANPR